MIAKPVAVRVRGCTRSVSLPTIGAITIETSAIGTNVSAASVGDMPRTSCRYSISGKPIAVAVKDMVEMAKLEIEKLRSRKSCSGTSGSLRLTACHHTNRARSTSPAMIRPHTEIGPLMVPQSYWWPSWMPNTSANMPSPLSATPSQSNLWACVGRFGTRRNARNRPTMPTGMLMKKIHSQPSPSTSTPPRIGPTSVATPAVAPHSAIARPRSVDGKIRVMTAIVCGVISAAPKPCTTRATMSISTVEVRPHHSEARVKIVRPTM